MMLLLQKTTFKTCVYLMINLNSIVILIHIRNNYNKAI